MWREWCGSVKEEDSAEGGDFRSSLRHKSTIMHMKEFTRSEHHDFVSHVGLEKDSFAAKCQSCD